MFNWRKARYDKIDTFRDSTVNCAFSFYISRRRVFDPFTGTTISIDIDPVEIPCGKCPQCRTKQVNDWIYRIEKELKQHVTSVFITLTYDEAHNQGEVSKEDLQKYFKRLRKAGLNFRYIAISEYGPQTQRPHYHAILFGPSIDNYDLLLTKWRHGHIELSKVTPGRVSYIARYHISTSLTNPRNVRKTFKLVSRRPGIGGAIRSELSSTGRTYAINGKGHKIRLPRYYHPPGGLPPKSRDELKNIVKKIKSDPNYVNYIAHYENLYYKSNIKLII